MAQVRILHASDLHISTQANITSPIDRFTPGTIKDAAVNRMLASSFDPAILLSFASFVFKRAQKGLLDAVLLTGDVSTTGSTEDLEKAFDFMHAPAEPGLGWQNREGEARLSNVNSLVWLLPGNHDRFLARPYGYAPGGKEFDESL